MIRFIILITLTSLVVTTSAEDRLKYRGLIEFQLAGSDSDQDLFSGGTGKFRYDDDSFPIRLGKLGLHLDYRLADTLIFKTMATAYADDGIEAGLNEIFLQYRPVPKGKMRLRAQVGAFYLPVSLENKGVAWSSRFSTTPSVINSWIGEEMRTIGTQLSLSWPGRFRQSPHDFSLTGAIYGFNDGIGTALDIQGWTAHDRQTGLFESFTLPNAGPGQKRSFKPFREIDDRPGYYVQGSWRYLGNLEFKFTHYDNRANYRARRDNQNAWETQFQHLSVEYEIKDNWKLLGQFIIGDTRAFNWTNSHLYKSDFDSAYLLLNHQRNKHKFTGRLEYFNVDENDDGSTLPSEENGFGIMLYYEYALRTNIGLTAEWSHIYSERQQRALLGGQLDEHENQVLLTVKYQF